MKPERNKKVKKKIVLTGGHAVTTALAVVEELAKKGGKESFWDIYWIGARRAVEGKKVPTLGAAIFPKMGVSFHPIFAGRLQRKFGFWTIPSLIKIPIGFLHALVLLLRIRPQIIISFGGFAAFPVVLMGWFLKIPIIIHEQTAVVGRANKFSAPFARKIAIARPESIKFFPRKKCVLVGNPVLPEIIEVPPKDKPGDPATIYITGGSLGSQSINRVVEEILEELLKKFIVVHHTGFLDFEKFKELKDSLPQDLSKNYEVYSIIDPTEIDGVYRRADIVISRAGANTVSEIVLVKRPAILIPLPFSFQDEQTKNAQSASRQGIARVLKQKDLTADKLLSEIEEIYENWEKIVKSIKIKPNPDIKAASRLVDLIEEIAK